MLWQHAALFQFNLLTCQHSPKGLYNTINFHTKTRDFFLRAYVRLATLSNSIDMGSTSWFSTCSELIKIITHQFMFGLIATTTLLHVLNMWVYLYLCRVKATECHRTDFWSCWKCLMDSNNNHWKILINEKCCAWLKERFFKKCALYHVHLNINSLETIRSASFVCTRISFQKRCKRNA